MTPGPQFRRESDKKINPSLVQRKEWGDVPFSIQRRGTSVLGSRTAWDLLVQHDLVTVHLDPKSDVTPDL
jgi:hypothetical protein